MESKDKDKTKKPKEKVGKAMELKDDKVKVGPSFLLGERGEAKSSPASTLGANCISSLAPIPSFHGPMPQHYFIFLHRCVKCDENSPNLYYFAWQESKDAVKDAAKDAKTAFGARGRG
jgi:hypothetical protein